MLNKWRVIRFVLGFSLIYLAQLLIAQSNPLVQFPFAESVSQYFHLDLVNPDNVFLSSILLIIGGLCIRWSLVNVPVFEYSSALTVSSKEPISTTQLIRTSIRLLIVAAVLFGILIVRLHALDNNPILVLIWITVLVLLLLACYRGDRQVGISASPGLNRYDIPFIIVICSFALLVGTYRLDWFPNSVIPDEVNHLEGIRAVALGTDTSSFFDFGVYTYPFPATYVQATIYKYFGQSLWSWRFASVLPAVLAVIPTYLFALALFNRRVAVLASVVMVVTPYFLAYERLGYLTSQSIFPIVMCLYLLYIGLERQSTFYVALSGIAGGLGFYTYFAARLGLVIGTTFLVFAVLSRYLGGLRADSFSKSVNRLQVRRLISLTGVFLIVGSATVLPVIIYQSAKNPVLLQSKTIDTLFPNMVYATKLFPVSELYRDAGPTVIDGESYFYRPDLYAVILVRGLIRSLLAFHTSAGLMETHYIAAPLPGTVAVVFYFVGLCFTLLRTKQTGVQLLFVWLASGVLLLSIINTFPPREDHLVPLMPAISILTALGIVICVDVVSQGLRAKRALTTQILAVTLTAIVVFSNLENYFVVVPQLYQPENALNVVAFSAFHMDKPQNIIYISPNVGGLDPEWVRFIPPSITYQQVHPVAFISNNYTIPNDEDTTFYFAEENAESISAVLANRYNNNIPVTANVALDGSGKPVVIYWTYYRPRP